MKGQRKPGQPQGRIAGAIRNMGSMGAQPRNDARIPPGFAGGAPGNPSARGALMRMQPVDRTPVNAAPAQDNPLQNGRVNRLASAMQQAIQRGRGLW